MMLTRGMRLALASALLVGLGGTSQVWGNGGPFVIKYPGGDPAAKGVLARLDADLRPGRETRLRVLKEDLHITFAKSVFYPKSPAPLAFVEAAYTIENATDDEITVDFGFPILRGIYISPLSMMPQPDVHVRVDKKHVRPTVITNSAIYGIIRERARQAIDGAVAKDAKLATLAEAVKRANAEQRAAARRALVSHLTSVMKWTDRDAALMIEYARLDFGSTKAQPRDRAFFWYQDQEMRRLALANLGALGAIGEQKATQFFAQLASRFDPEAAAAYEAIFTAWGGDIRERSVDLSTGAVRPREISVTPAMLNAAVRVGDPTIYARVDYLDEKAKISEAEKASCRAVLKNLPVVFTFAPMNLLHYQVKFPARATQLVTVSYRQFAYSDTKKPESYQLAYVVHPGSMWDEFGPINLEVAAPAGVPFRASVACKEAGEALYTSDGRRHEGAGTPSGVQRCTVYRSTLTEKTGEIFMAVDAAAWRRATGAKPAKDVAPPVTVKGAVGPQAFKK